MLDLDRAQAWLKGNRNARKLKSESIYQWLVTFLQELFLPPNDKRWRTSQLRCIAYLSFELGHRNFLLRRNFPHKLWVEQISQCQIDKEDLGRLRRGKLVELLQVSDIQNTCREVAPNEKSDVRCRAIPAIAADGLRGMLLLFYVDGAPIPPDVKLKELGEKLGDFAKFALGSRNVRAKKRRPGVTTRRGE